MNSDKITPTGNILHQDAAFCQSAEARPQRDGEAPEDLPVHQSVVRYGLTESFVGGRSCIQRPPPLPEPSALQREVDEVVAEAARNKMRRHTSYLKPKTVVFCLASEAVNADHLAEVVSILPTRPEDPETEETLPQSLSTSRSDCQT